MNGNDAKFQSGHSLIVVGLYTYIGIRLVAITGPTILL